MLAAYPRPKNVNNLLKYILSSCYIIYGDNRLLPETGPVHQVTPNQSSHFKTLIAQ
jgi:hypothetical protein